MERVLICGDRNWTNLQMIQEVLSEWVAYGKGVECVIEGEARGADTLGRIAAERMGIKVLPFPANWEKYGRAAGPIRNQQMLDEGRPTVVLAFHNDIANSRGTIDMVRRARKAKIYTDVIMEVRNL